jgi:signal transduction histidine kinase
MTTKVLMRSDSPRREAAGKALREAGVGVVEVDDWSDAPQALQACGAALVVCNADLEALDAARLTKALTDLVGAPPVSPLAADAARALSHALRTPLSAMAGWVHLIEEGKLDEAGIKRAASKLRANIDDQVRTIERYLGATRTEGRG